MATKTQIANKTMINIGEAIFSDVDADGTTPADEFNALWTPTLEDALTTGPEQGYAFSRWTNSDIDIDSVTITAFADLVTDTTTTVTGTHSFVAGDNVIITDTTSYDGTYTVQSVSTTVSFVIKAAFVADDATGTAKWTSEKYAYRYARPTSLQVTRVCDGGMELSDWIRKGNWILTNQTDTDVEMDYIRAVADLTVTEFPPWFNEVVWRKMAIGMSYARVQSLGFRDRLLQEIEQIYLPRAKGMDSREQFVQESSNSWVNAGRRTGIEGDLPLNPVPTIFKK